MKTVAYLTHPLGSKSNRDLVERADDISNMLAWVRFLVIVSPWAILCPWHPYLSAIDDEFFQPRALADQVAILQRCDLMVAAGGRWTRPMQTQRRGCALPVIDLTDLGYKPPELDIGVASELIRERAVAAGLIRA